MPNKATPIPHHRSDAYQLFDSNMSHQVGQQFFNFNAHPNTGHSCVHSDEIINFKGHSQHKSHLDWLDSISITKYKG